MFARLAFCSPGLTLLLPVSASAQQIQQPPQWSHGHHMWDGMMWGIGGFFGPFFMLLLFALLIGLVIMAVRMFSGPDDRQNRMQGPEGQTPVEILRQRFARGEIDKADFEERLKILQS